MSAALLLYMVKPEMSMSEKFEYVHDFFTKMAGGQHVGFQNSTFLSERDTADREGYSKIFVSCYWQLLELFCNKKKGPKKLESYRIERSKGV